MGIFLIILIIVLVCWPWISPYISRWIRNFMSRRAEDMMRRMMGMPSRKEERKKARRQESEKRKGAGGYSSARGRKKSRHATHPAELMKKVAEDVEYVEIKEFESTTIIEDDGDTQRVYHEEQVTDVEYTEIKTKS